MGELDAPALRRIVRIALLAGLLALKVPILAGIADFGIDGSLYFEVARNVRDGRGLVSFISVMNAGVEHFPHRTPLYPIWPLLLGFVGRVIPIELAAMVLPTLFFFGTLVLADRLAREVWPGPLVPSVWEVPDAGHLAILVLGYNRLFFEATSRPYTEGLAFLGLFALLFRVRRFFAAPTELGAAELGAWAGLLMLIRAQMFIVTLVLAATFAVGLLLWAPRGPWVRLTAAAFVGWAAALAPQVAWLSTFYHPLGLDALLRFDAFRASDALAPLQTLKPATGLIAWLADRAEGFAVAYRNTGKHAYIQNFGVLHWAPVVAVGFGLWRWRSGGLDAWKRARDGRHGADVFFALLALGGFFSLHTLHKDFGAEWNFALRHALTVLFLFTWGVVTLGRRPGAPAFAAVAIVAITAWKLGHDMHGVYTAAERRADSYDEDPRAVAQWLAQRRARDPDMVVAGSYVQRLAVHTPGLPLHWVWTGTSWDDLETLFGRFGVDYLVLTQDADKYDFAADPGWPMNYERVVTDLSGLDVWRRRAPSPSSEPPDDP